MAESTLIASAPDRPRTTLLKADRAAIEEGRFTPDQGTGDWREFVSCGHALPESELLIVDPKIREVLAEDHIGEVWLRGPSVASGYLHGPGDSFGAVTSDGRGDCLRTGDLGFLHDGELYLSGRSKDLIVIAGRNIHPTDLEWTAEHAHPLIAPNSTAAFAVEGEDSEEPILLVELRGGADDEAALRAVRSAITSEHDCDLRAIIPMERGTIPRTTSGKARRAACRKLYESGRLGGASGNTERDAKET
jgi:acyl-CoA synthetase (AMP-forming)/AMP-acid ligase II